MELRRRRQAVCVSALYCQISRAAVANPANGRPNTWKGPHIGTLLNVHSVFFQPYFQYYTPQYLQAVASPGNFEIFSIAAFVFEINNKYL